MATARSSGDEGKVQRWVCLHHLTDPKSGRLSSYSFFACVVGCWSSSLCLQFLGDAPVALVVLVMVCVIAAWELSRGRGGGRRRTTLLCLVRLRWFSFGFVSTGGGGPRCGAVWTFLFETFGSDRLVAGATVKWLVRFRRRLFSLIQEGGMKGMDILDYRASAG